MKEGLRQTLKQQIEEKEKIKKKQRQHELMDERRFLVSNAVYIIDDMYDMFCSQYLLVKYVTDCIFYFRYSLLQDHVKMELNEKRSMQKQKKIETNLQLMEQWKRDLQIKEFEDK